MQTIANSPYKDDTLIFVIEDDAQDGGDHVDAHRSIAFIVGPYVKQGAVVSKHYTTLSMFRTIEDILGTGHTNLNDSLAVPMTDVFDKKVKEWTFTASPSGLLCGTGVTPCLLLLARALPLFIRPTMRPTGPRSPKVWTSPRKTLFDGAQFNRISFQLGFKQT